MAFYGEAMTDDAAYTFLKNNYIAYVFYSDKEQLYTPDDKSLDYPFLMPVYNKNGTVIYKVR